jgi:hypothetical protein
MRQKYSEKQCNGTVTYRFKNIHTNDNGIEANILVFVVQVIVYKATCQGIEGWILL